MAKLTQKQVEDWIAQNGGPSGVQYSVEQKQIKNPDPGSPDPYVNIEVEVWRNSKTGAELSARRVEGGDFEQIEAKSADPNKPAAGQTPADKNAAELQRQREKNAALPPDQDPAYETDEERRNRAQATIKQQGAEAEAARQRQRQEDADKRAEADRNKPGAPTIKPDGKGGSIAVQTMPDGSIKTTPLPGVPSDKPQPQHVTVGGTVYERGPDGTYKPAVGLPSASAAEPTGAPRSTDVIGRTTQNLTEYSQWLNTQVEQNRKDPTKGLTPAQADKLLDQRIKMANAAVQEQQGVVNTQTGVYGQQITDRGQTLRDSESRRNSVQGVYNNLVSTFAPLARYAGAGGGEALGQAIIAGMDYYISKAGGVGGFKDTPSPTLGPAAAGVNRMGLPGAPYAGGPAAGERLTFGEMNDPNGAPLITNATGQPAPPTPPAFLPQAAAAQEAARQVAAASGGAATGTPAAPAPPAPPAPVASATPADAAAAASPTIITVRNKRTGETLTMPLAEFNARPDVLDWEPLDPNAPPAPAVMPPTPVPDVGPAYAPQMSSVPPGSTGTQHVIGTPPPPPQAAPFQDDQREPAAAPGFQIPRPGDPWPVAPQSMMPPSSQGTFTHFMPDEATMVRASQKTQMPEGMGDLAAMYGHTADNPLMPPGSGPAFLQPYQQQPAPSMSSPALQEMINDPWLDNSIIAQAYQNVMNRRRGVAA